MMKVCQYSNCDRKASYFMGWINENGKPHWGFVCATHDKMLGRTNLIRCGMSLGEAIAFERYLKDTIDLMVCPDWSEWLEQHLRKHGESEDDITSVRELNLPSVTSNALYRHQILTIDELEDTPVNELMKIRMIGIKGITEIQRALKDYNEQN